MPKKIKLDNPEISEVVTDEPETTKAASEDVIVTVTVDKLNVRSESNTSSKPATVISRNDKLLVDTTFKNKEWLKVTTMDGINGYVMKKFVK